jgi:hypothetical protein
VVLANQEAEEGELFGTRSTRPAWKHSETQLGVVLRKNKILNSIKDEAQWQNTWLAFVRL